MKEVLCYICEKCNAAYYSPDEAENCCKAGKCRVCGIELKPYLCICEDCYRQEKFQRAKKVKLSEYDGPLYDDITNTYYKNHDELYEHYEDNPDESKPKWCYSVVAETFNIDIDLALEHMEEEMDEDCYDRDCLVDLQELYDFISKWNAKQIAESYYPDWDKIVILYE